LASSHHIQISAYWSILQGIVTFTAASTMLAIALRGLYYASAGVSPYGSESFEQSLAFAQCRHS
jgi:hypothetical protein